jgi:hypothetical protein
MRRADRASETHAQTQLPTSIEYPAALPCGSRSDGGRVHTRSRVLNQNALKSFKPERAL